VREQQEVTARQKQQIIDAKTNGIPNILPAGDISETSKPGTLAECGRIPSALLGGQMTPYINDSGSGCRIYEGVDVNAYDESGVRRSYRRFQRLFPKEGIIPAIYKGNNHFVMQWAMVPEVNGEPVNQVYIWVSM